MIVHEEDHIRWLKENAPDACKGKGEGDDPTVTSEQAACSECDAYGASNKCLAATLSEYERKKAKPYCQAIIRHQKESHEIDEQQECAACPYQ